MSKDGRVSAVDERTTRENLRKAEIVKKGQRIRLGPRIVK